MIIQFSDYTKPEIDSNYKRDGLFKYALSYKFNDKIFSIDIWAESVIDAEQRVEAIKNSLEYVGQLIEEV